MPRLTGATASRSGTISYVDVHGVILTVSLDDLPLTATDALVSAFQDSMADLSNAAVFRQTVDSVYTLDIEAAIALDEAESSVSTVARLKFQNRATLEKREFIIPAIDLSYVDRSGDYLVTRIESAQIDAAVSAALAILGVNWLYYGSIITTFEQPIELSNIDIDIVVDELGIMELFELSFTYLNAPFLALLSVPALATIISLRLHIDVPFNVPTTITVGDIVLLDRLMQSEQNNPLEIGLYEVEPDYEYPAITSLMLSINAPGATAGAGRIIIEYDKE